MARVAHIARELIRNLVRHPGTALVSLLSLTLLFMLFDAFWVAAGTSDRFYRDLLSELRVEVFLDEAAPDTSIASITRELISIEGVYSAQHISREQARERLTALVGSDLLVGYEESNPLPRSFILTLGEEYLNSADLEQLEAQIGDIEGTAEVHYSRGWLEKAEEAKAVILEIGLVLGVLILAAALVSSANNIRLMARARAVGFRQMLLLGAGRLFVAFPFIIEGFLIGGVSAAVGWLIILYGRTRIQFVHLDIVFPTNEEIVAFCLLTAVAGAISGYLGLRKLLRA
jgi:cell division transport system permease protein